MAYYIETSLDRIYFDSDDLANVLIVCDYGEKVKEEHIKMDDDYLVLLYTLYDFERITVKVTDNGCFMKIGLSDGYYGSPE